MSLQLLGRTTPATWRSTLPPTADGSVGVAFNLEDGSPVRLLLDAQSVYALLQTLKPGYFGRAAEAMRDPANLSAGNTGFQAPHPTRIAPCSECRHFRRSSAACDHPTVPAAAGYGGELLADDMRRAPSVLRGDISRFVRTHGCVPCGPAGRLHEPLAPVQAAENADQPIAGVGDVVAHGIDGHGQDESAEQRGVRERVARAPLHVQQVHRAIEEFLGHARAGV